MTRLWLEPEVHILAAAADAIAGFDAAIIGPGSFYTSLMPIFLVRGAAEAIREMSGPIILVANLLTEGRGMWQFTAGEAVRRRCTASDGYLLTSLAGIVQMAIAPIVNMPAIR